MLKFKQFTEMALANRIEKSSKETSVTNNNTYKSAKDFKPNSTHIGHVGKMELHAYDTQGGRSHFTFNPNDHKIHHVVHASQAHGKELKFLSAHAREGSPVKMHQVYASLIKDHGYHMVGSSHSVGAQKLWNKLETHHGISIHGRNPSTGETRKLNPGEPRYAPMSDKHSKIGKMHLVAKAD